MNRQQQRYPESPDSSLATRKWPLRIFRSFDTTSKSFLLKDHDLCLRVWNRHFFFFFSSEKFLVEILEILLVVKSALQLPFTEY